VTPLHTTSLGGRSGPKGFEWRWECSCGTSGGWNSSQETCRERGEAHEIKFNRVSQEAAK